MASTSNCYDVEDKLCSYIQRLDAKNVEKLLFDGANATKVTSNGRSAIGFAALTSGATEILRILLRSCEENTDDRTTTDTSLQIVHQSRNDHECENNRTPDGMENLLWEEEIIQGNNLLAADDEWSKLYIYYARMIEKTGDILANTIKIKDPHCLDAFSHAPIHYSAILGDFDGVDILLQYNSPVDITTNSGYTPLHLAVEHTDIVRLLLLNKADPNKRTFHNQETPLHVAARCANIVTVSLLLDAGADINATCALERTPLIMAIASKNLNVSHLLIDWGAKINIEDSEGVTPLYCSIAIDNVQLAEKLLKKGARIYVRLYLMHYCIRNNMLDMLKLLFDYDRDNVNIREDSSGYTPLMLAIAEQNPQIVKLLIDYGSADINRDDFPIKELHITIAESQCIEQFITMSRILLPAGINIDNCNYWGETPLHHAIMFEKYQCAEYLLKQGADVHCRCTSRYADSLILARQAGNVNLLKIMVNIGLRIHNEHRPNALKPPPWHDDGTNTEDYLAIAVTNPLSLQQLTRICIRNRLITTMKSSNSRRINLLPRNSEFYERWDGSMLMYLIARTGLPRLLIKYLYEFPDVPLVEMDRVSMSTGLNGHR